MEFLNNTGSERLGDALSDAIDDNAKLSVIASYFTIFGYGELCESLSKIDSLRFVFNEPTFIKQMQSDKEPRRFELSMRDREKGIGGVGLELTLSNNLKSGALARECVEWIREKGEFRTAKFSGTAPSGCLYHIENTHREDHAFTGAKADFTLEGLGYEHKPHAFYDSVSHFQTAEETDKARANFEELWNDFSTLEDVTEEVIDQVGTLYRENSPEFIYFLTLYHLFRDYLEQPEDDPIGSGIPLEDTQIWNRLYDFQRDAVVGAIRKLERYKGCIIADSVGLGKTYEALAIIRFYELRNERVLVLAPKRLRDNWTLYRANDVRNVLSEDRFSYDVLNHTDLSRYSGHSGDIDLANVNWGAYNLVVIDESHNFRNKPTDRSTHSRYDRLMDDIIRQGVRTKVLMLSATPVNNRLLDLRNQIEIITEGNDAYLSETEGIPSITQVTSVAQQHFNEWNDLPEGRRTTQSFVETLNSDYFRLLDIFTIARSRKHISKYYPSNGATFPERRKPISLHTGIDTQGELPSIKELNDQIASLSFVQYQLLSYVLPEKQQRYADQYEDTWGSDFDSQINRTQGIVNLVRVNLLKRLESSIHSFQLSLQRMLEGAKSLQESLDNLEAGFSYGSDFSEEEFDDEDDCEEFLAGGKVRVDLRDVDQAKVKADLLLDIETLEELLDYANKVTPERDAKLQALKEFIDQKVADPYNPSNRKFLIFSAFADTVRYLYEQLSPYLKDVYGMYSATVSGTGNMANLKLGRTTFDNILAHFSPVSKELPQSERETGVIDVVFATDCISEGQNLQDCDCVVNYDIHWNPVRITQRFGRIDRLGSDNTQIQLVNFWPDIELDEYIQLEGRVKGRMVLMDASASGEENVLESTAKEEMNDLEYRRQQLQQLQEEVLDLEDISGGISITDFAFDDFRVELRGYAEEHPDLLERSSTGLYALAPIPDSLREEVAPGVIFCLKQNDEDLNPKDTNPVFPYYLVYVGEDGQVRGKYTNPKQALDNLRGLCSGQKEPFVNLCQEFNRQTHDGTDMSRYEALLQKAVEAITGVMQEKGVESLFSSGEVGDTANFGFDDYSLIAFLVIR